MNFPSKKYFIDIKTGDCFQCPKSGRYFMKTDKTVKNHTIVIELTTGKREYFYDVDPITPAFFDFEIRQPTIGEPVMYLGGFFLLVSGDEMINLTTGELVDANSAAVPINLEGSIAP